MKKEEAKQKYQDGEAQILFDDVSKLGLLKEITENYNYVGKKDYYYYIWYNGTMNSHIRNDDQEVIKMSEIEEEVIQAEQLNTPKHYDNSKGTLYKVAKERGWNPYLFDIVKRLERAEKKGEFDSDLDKSINVIKLWKEESKCQQ